MILKTVITLEDIKCWGSDPRMRKIFSPTTFPCVSNTYKRGVSVYPRSIAC